MAGEVAGEAGLPGLPAGVPRVSAMVKPVAEMEEKVMAMIKPMAKPLIDPAYKFLTTPLAAMGVEVMAEAPTPVEAIAFTAKQIEAGKLPIPTKLPGAETMMPTLPGMPGVGAMFAPPPVEGAGAVGAEEAEEGGITPSPGTYTAEEEEERVLPEEARPGGLVSSLYSLEESRKRMWMSL